MAKLLGSGDQPRRRLPFSSQNLRLGPRGSEPGLHRSSSVLWMSEAPSTQAGISVTRGALQGLPG